MNDLRSRLSLAALVLIFSSGLAAQEDFNPSSVMPGDCKNGSMRCGFTPPSADELRSLTTRSAGFVQNRELPPNVDLSPMMPPVGFQGEQGSCLGWSLAYAIRSYQEKKANSWTYDAPFAGGEGARVLSPAFLYNQINGGRDQGSDPVVALNLLVRKGVSSWKLMPYVPADFKSQPGPEATAEASRFRAKSFRALDVSSLEGIKSEISRGSPIMLGLLLYENFYKLNRLTPVYNAFSGKFYGGHAVTIVGYDDNRKLGAETGGFKVQNSWGTGWADGGYAWIPYSFFPIVASVAFVIEERPRGFTSPPVPERTLHPPDDVSATRGSYADRVELAWTQAEGAIAYEIQRRSGSSNFEKIGYAVDSKFTDNAVQSGTLYLYRLIAIYRSGRSDAERSPVAEGFPRPPGAIAGFVLPPVIDLTLNQIVAVLNKTTRAFAADDSRKAESSPAQPSAQGSVASAIAAQPIQTLRVDMKWQQSEGAEWYEVYRFDPGFKSWKLIGNAYQPGFSDPQPLPGGTNIYQVRARSRTASSPFSTPVILASDLPGRVGRLEVGRAVSKDRIDLKWDAVPGAEKYLLFTYDSDKKDYVSNTFVEGTQFTDNSALAKSGRWVGYSVAAVNAWGQSSFTQLVFGRSDPLMQRSISESKPPEGLVATGDKDGISLKWTIESAVAGKPSLKYYVFRKKETDADFAFLAEVGSNTFKDSGVKAGALYYYVVRSYSDAGESPDSNVVAASAGTLRAPPTSRGMLREEGFAGKWKSVSWDAKGVHSLSLNIRLDQGNAYAVVTSNLYGSKTTAGTHLPVASEMSLPGMRARISGKLISVQFYDLAPLTGTFVFQRDI